MHISTLVEGKIPVKALIDTSSRFNTISKSLFDKLKEDCGLGCLSGDELIGREIKCLDLQFHYKGKWRSLDGTEVIDFQIHKNPSFDLVLGQDWLWMREAKISFGFSLGTCKHYAKIEIDGMSIPLIKEDSRPFRDDSLNHKASSTKNNLSKSTESKPDLAQEEVINIINKILSDLGDGCGNLTIKTHLNNIWKSVHSIENDIETNSSSSDSESTGSDWYDLDPIKFRKNRVHIKKKKVDSPIRKHRKKKRVNCVHIP
ncbi:28707_t:CDS:2, partial [Racocetra persica]